MARKKAKETAPEIKKRTAPDLQFLPVAYTTQQLLDMAQQLARTSSERDQTQEQFEVLKKNHNHQTEALENSIRSLTRNIGRGHHYENVDCFWILEEPTQHEKTLVRKDTGEIVRVLPMEKFDYQEVLLPAVLQPDAKPGPVATDNDFQLSPAVKPEPKSKTPPSTEKTQ